MPSNAHSVINVIPKGKKKVVDLEMKSKFHNFVANGIAVGNSHALSYSLISSRCLYLKVYYPIEYFTAVLSHLKTGNDRVKIYVQEGIRKGLKFKPVNINKSKLGYQIIDDEIFVGFDKIKGINKEAKNLIEMQPFSSFEDYISRYGLNKKVGETLISCGAFKEFHNNVNLLLSYFEYRREIGNKQKGMNRLEFGKAYKELTGSKSCPREISSQFTELLQEDETKMSYEKIIKLALSNKFNFIGIDKNKIFDYIESNKSKFKHSILSLNQFQQNKTDNKKEIKDLNPFDKSLLEREYYTFYFNHPLVNTRREGFKIGDVIYSNAGGTIEGMIGKIQRRQTKSGNAFYVITLEDELDSVQIALWGNQIGKYRHLIHEYAFIKIDIMPSEYSTWNMSKYGNIERIRTLQEMSESEERNMNSTLGYNDLITSLKEYQKNESL